MEDKPVKTGDADLGDKGSRREGALDTGSLTRREGGIIGRTTWVVPGGCIPLHGTGQEPMFTSSDKICLLNSCAQTANARITIFFEDAEPIGPFSLSLGPRRVRHIRFSNLIFPQAIPLETEYAALILSDLPIVVQFSRMDTRQPENAGMTTIAYYEDD